MFIQLAEHLETSDEALERLRSAAIYPSFVLLLGIGVAVLLLGVLVPRAQAALAAGGMALPAASLLVVRVARLAALLAAAGLLLLALGAVAVSLLCHRNPAHRRRLHRQLLRLPVAGRLIARLAAARFASTLAVLSRAGVPLVEGLVLAGQATGNLHLQARLTEVADEVRQGEAPSQAVERVTEIGPWLAEWMRVGEAGGCLDAMLSVAAQRARSGWERSVGRLLTLFEPLVLVCVGLFVLAVALAVLLPVTSLTRAIR
jgi:general secretion pathway protein F